MIQWSRDLAPMNRQLNKRIAYVESHLNTVTVLELSVCLSVQHTVIEGPIETARGIIKPFFSAW